MNPLIFFILLGVGLILTIVVFVSPLVSKLFKYIKLKIQSIIRNSKTNVMSEKFDVLRWHPGDDIKYRTTQRFDSTYSTSTKKLCSFTEEGIYVTSYHYYDWFEKGKYNLVSNEVDFIPTNRIIENLTLPKRKIEEGFLDSVTDEQSYNNQLMIIQDELYELNKEFKQDKNKIRV